MSRPRKADITPLAPSGDTTTLPVAKADFTSGTDGSPRLAWARYGMPVANTATWGYGAPVGGYPARERGLASAISTDLVTSNPTIATIVETLTTYTLGEGLTLSSKPDAAALGITPEETRDLSRRIEAAWAGFVSNPTECDLAGRHTLHEIVSAAFKIWLREGEALLSMDWAASPGGLYGTKVSLLSPRQIESRSQVGPGNTRTVYGVTFNQVGRIAGYWLRAAPLGAISATGQATFVPVRTRWGRPKIVHVFELLDAGQVRGLSPIIAALTPAHEKNTLQEFTLANALTQTSFAMTVESDLPPPVALDGLAVGNGPEPLDPLAMREAWYTQSKIQPSPGVVNHLAPGDKLKMNRPETPTTTYGQFNDSLLREAAKAAGASFEDISGDYSKTSFSASRLATELPHRITLKRRKTIAARLYQSVFECFVEEAIERRIVLLPKNAPDFTYRRAAYTTATWLGNGRPVADQKKQAEADVLEVENGLRTLSDVLAERGLDFDEVVEQRKYERDALKAAGLSGPVGALQTKVTVAEDEPGEVEPASKESNR